MKVQYNREDDILLLEVSGEKIDHAEEAEGVIVHFSEEDRPVLMEILDASDFLARLTKITASAGAGEPVTL